MPSSGQDTEQNYSCANFEILCEFKNILGSFLDKFRLMQHELVSFSFDSTGFKNTPFDRSLYSCFIISLTKHHLLKRHPILNLEQIFRFHVTIKIFPF